ncbi:MAG: DUF3078 domain-containing protein [Bacteroidetes bacterium]|nr:DUF3078 domain-containing protein [Bacteroidota bacterium]
MRKILLPIVLLASQLLFSQADSTKLWKKGGTLSLGLTQVSLTNWAAGGQNSIAIASLVELFSNYKKDKTTWDNNLSMGYGIINQDKKLRNDMWFKNDDRFQLTSKFGHYAFKKWYYSGLLDFKTQFTPGYNDPLLPDSLKTTISDFLAPGYGIVALGMDYKTTDLTVLIAPLTGKFTVVNNQTLADAGAFGVEKAVYDTSIIPVKVKNGKRFRGEFGGYIKAKYVKDLTKTISFKSNLELFSNYITDPSKIDVFWDNLLTIKVMKYVAINYNAIIIYDDDIAITDVDGNTGPRTQFKSVLSANFSYKF